MSPSSSLMLTTSPPNSSCFDAGGAQALLRGVLGRGQAGDAGADDDHIEIRIGHGFLLITFVRMRRRCAAGGGLRRCGCGGLALRRGGAGGAVAAPSIGAKSLRILRMSPMRCVMPSRSRHSRISIARPRPTPVRSRYCAAVNWLPGAFCATTCGAGGELGECRARIEALGRHAYQLRWCGSCGAGNP